MNNILSYLLKCLSIALTLLVLFGCQPIEQIANSNQEGLQIEKHFSLLVAPQAKFNYRDIFQIPIENGFVHPVSNQGLGNTDLTYWYKTTLSSELLSDKHFLELPFSLLDKCDIWFVSKTGELIAHDRAGAQLAYQLRTVKSHHLLFKLPEEQRDNLTIIISINTASVVHFTPVLWDESDWERQENRLSEWYGLLFGATSILILYNLFLAFALRDTSYLYYVLYLLGLSIINATSAGLIDRFIWPTSAGLASHSLLFVVALTTVFDFLFINRFLKIKKNFPKAWKLSVWLMFVIVPPALPELFGFTNLGVFNGIFVGVVLAISFFGIVFYWGLALKAYQRGIRESRFFILAFTVFIASYIAYQLYSFQWIGHSLLAAHILEFGALAEGILLSLALADKVNILSEGKKIAEEKAINANKQFARNFIQQQENERELFSSALHDSVGHSILVLKQNLENNQFNQNAEEMETSDLVESREQNAGKKQEYLLIQARLCSSISEEIKNLSNDIHPYDLQTHGLKKALVTGMRNAFLTKNIETNIDIPDDIDRLDSDLKLAIYRVIQESLNNILKHANAKKVDVEMLLDDKSLIILIVDDGIGIENIDEVFEGIGLSTIRGRLALYKGNVHIDSHPMRGTKLILTVPIAEVSEKITETNSAKRAENIKQTPKDERYK